MTNIEIDTLSRNRIVTETDKNFFVEAGAGSGKTTMLVSRMVAMVEAGIDISKICAITFTKAAAGEFYERFQKLLIERSNPEYKWVDKGYAGQLPKPTEESMKRCAEALINIDLCFMGTIDSFCSMVLSEHPSAAGIPSDASIMSDLDAQNLYKQIYVKICAGEYGERLKELANIFNLLHWGAQDVFVAGVSVLMNNRNVRFNFSKRDAIDINKLFKEDKAAINRALQCLAEHPELKYEGNKDSVAAWEKLEEQIRKLKGRWSNNFSGIALGIKALGSLRVIPQAMDKYASSLEGVFEPGGKQGKWLEFVPAQEGGLLNKLNSIRYEASMTFISECIPVIEEVMRQKGAMTYFDYLYYLRNMLKNDAKDEGKLIRYIYDRHSFFLIDEFQDTNPMQAEVFFYLSSENPVEQWSACKPKPGSLFIVGDPKQSIYRFRSADVTSFLKVKKLFKENGGDILYLSRNFRSTKGLCNYFNSVFSEMLPTESEVQSKFDEIPLPDKDSDEFQGIYKYTAYTGSLEGDYPEETDPKQITKIINGLVGKESYKVSLEDENPRPIKYSDIMVITYGKSKINGIMEALDEEEIPMRVEGKVPFERNDALIQLHALYSAVADTEDTSALYLALLSKFFNITEEEMMKYRLAGGEISLKANVELPENADSTVKKVANAIEKIKELSFKANRLSPAALFAEIMDGHEIYKVAKAENLEVLYYTLELIRNAEKTGVVASHKDGADYLSKLVNGNAEEERCLSLSENQEVVHIANLHKVKGLEAPIVILAAATQFGSGVSTRIIHGDNGSEGYIFDVQSKRDEGTSFSYFKTDDFENEKLDEKAANSAEQDRLLYVGATRARNALIICSSVGKSGKGQAVKSIWKPLLEKCGDDIFSIISEQDNPAKIKKEEVEVSGLYNLAADSCILRERKSENNTYKIENPSYVRVSSKLEDDGVEENNTGASKENNKEEASEHYDAHRFPALLGTMTHKLMEIIVSSSNSSDVNQVIDEIIREYRTPKNQPYEKELTEALKAVASTMSNGGYAQENEAPKDLLRILKDADEVYCEVPFCYKDEDDKEVAVWNGIMDVIYRESDKWHIIDYKTNIEGDNLDKKYKGQLDAYKRAFKAITGNEADAYTYHIDI